jgi:hypothetical protein
MVTKNSSSKSAPQRRYPPFWEKAIPVFLVVLGCVIAVMLAVTIAVALGVFPAS